MTIKEMYQYFWYKVYKFTDKFVATMAPNFRTGCIVGAIEGMLLISLLFYYQTFLAQGAVLPNTIIWWLICVIVIPLGIIEWNVIHRGRTWKMIVAKYDKWPKKQQQRGTLIVFGVVLIIIANLIVAICLMSSKSEGLHIIP